MLTYKQLEAVAPDHSGEATASLFLGDIMYDSIKEQLTRRGLPPVAIILGARQSGKTTLIQDVIAALSYNVQDVTWWTPLMPDEIVNSWFNSAPYSYKKVLVFDDNLTPHMREKLLSRIEDLPETHSIVIATHTVVIDTLFSRADTYKLSYDDSHAPPVYTEVKGVVLALLRAFQDRDMEALNEVATRWSDNHTALLLTWCEEKLTKQFEHFTGEEVDVPDQLPMLLLKSMVSDVRPRFLIRGPIAELLWSLK